MSYSELLVALENIIIDEVATVPTARSRKHGTNAPLEIGMTDSNQGVGRQRVTVTAGTDRRCQVTTPTTVEHIQRWVTPRSTEHSCHASVIGHKTNQISCSRQCRHVVRWQTHQRLIFNVSGGSEDTESKVLVPLAAEYQAGSVFWRRLVRRQSHQTIGVSWSDHERRTLPKAWTKKQQVVSLSSSESELYAAVKTASEGLGIQSVARDMGISCGLNPMCLVSRRGLGKAMHVDIQNLWMREASKAGRFVTKKVGTNVNPADLTRKPLAKPKIEQLVSIMGYEFLRTDRGFAGRDGMFVTWVRFHSASRVLSKILALRV